MKLPKVNDLGFFEIRLESIGGMGANSAGKMLADVGVLSQGYNGAAFSSYGSEKKGSPVKSFVRFADSETSVRVNSTVEEPHVVAVFHMNLLKNPMTLMGVKDDAIVIFNTNMSPKEARDFAKLHGGKVVCGSGLNCVNLAAAKILAGEADIVIAGGMENMSLAPFCLDKARFGYRMNNGVLKDCMVNDALTDAFNSIIWVSQLKTLQNSGILQEKN